MRIGVDATCWHNRRGYGRHARALLRSLIRLDSGNRYTLFLDSTESAEPVPAECEVQLLASSVPTVQAASADGRRSLRDMWRMSRALSSPEFDLLLFPTIYSFVPVFSAARRLVMVHDVIAETFPQLTTPRRTARLFWNAKVALGRMQADAIVTVSNYSRDGIVRHFGTDPAHVFVVGEAADPVFHRFESPEPQACPTVVYVGGFSPHKNLEALVAAFARVTARAEFAYTRMVMVGDTSGDAFHSYFGTIAAQVNALGLEQRVVFPGYLDDQALAALLNSASVLALPSLMEGFGLPAVEAAACGCPVIATIESPLPDLLSGGGIFIDPTEDNIAGALEQVLASEDARRQMGEAALAAARLLTWDESARQMMAVIRQVSQ